MYNKPIGSSREIPVDFDQVQVEDLSIKNLESTVRVSRTREGLLLQVEAEAEVKTNCVRCIKEFYLPVQTEFEELFQFPSRHREDTDLVLPADGFIDLSELYREYLILAIPIRHVCQPDCLGLCVVCGVNLNNTNCEHHPRSDEPLDNVIDEEKV